MKKTNDTSKIIEIKNVNKYFGAKPAVNNVSFSIKKGEFITLLGPSGCGKTTTLRMIAGFEKPTDGQILFNGEDITTVPPYRRNLNTVFQKYALFPHLDVFNNVAFGLKNKLIENGTKQKGDKTYQLYRKLTKAELSQKVERALKMVDLEDYGYRSVDSLSGGQQQRVAIARALVNEPEVLLLDEPLGALDLKMRKDMQLELKAMHKNLGITFVYVTHDQEEALTMSDRIIIMKNGVIQQIGTPKQVYDEPANAFVADFIGESNIFSGTMKSDFCVNFINHDFECVDKGFKRNEPIDVIIRPEDWVCVAKDDEKAQLQVKVSSCVFKGDHFLSTVNTVDEEENEIQIRDNIPKTEGDVVGLYVRPFDIQVMHKERIINTVEGEMVDDGVVEFCNGKFQCNTDLPIGTKVKVSIDFDDVVVHDDEEDGIIGATVVSSIYKGSYYQCIVRTDEYFDFFVDTEDDWLVGDRVGISVAQDKLIIEVLPDEED